MSFADTLPEDARKRYRRCAVLSTCCGCVGEQLIDTNSILILYLTSLGAGASLSVFSTSLSVLAYALFLIPCAGISDRLGLKRSAFHACAVAFCAFFLMAVSPAILPARYAGYAVIGGCFLYGITRPLYLSTWYPFLDNFLTNGDRANFFGKMRFTYMLVNVCAVFLIGRLMGYWAKPPLWLFQIIFAVGGFLQLMRFYYMNKFPLSPEQLDTTRKKFEIKGPLQISCKNTPLVGLSLYLCLMNIVMASLMPTTYVLLKSDLHTPESDILLITTFGMTGSIIGYYFSGKLIGLFGTRMMLILQHITFIILPACFCFQTAMGWTSLWIFSGLNFYGGFFSAIYSVIGSSEMLASARPGNKTMAMAFCSTLQNIGSAAGRIVASFVLGCAILAPEWKLFHLKMGWYQAMQLSMACLGIFFLLFLMLVPSVMNGSEKGEKQDSSDGKGN